MMRVQVPHNIPILEIIREFTKVMGINENKCSASIIDMKIAVDYVTERRIGVASGDEYDRFKAGDDDDNLQPQVQHHYQQPTINDLGGYVPILQQEENPYLQNYVPQDPNYFSAQHTHTRSTSPFLPHDNRNRFFENTEFLYGSTPGVTIFPLTFLLSEIDLPAENGILDIIYAPHFDEVQESFCQPFGQNRCPYL